MPLLEIQLPLFLEAVHAYPRIRTSANHKFALLDVERDGGQGMRGVDPLDELPRSIATEEVGRFARRNAQNGLWRAVDRIELAAAKSTF